MTKPLEEVYSENAVNIYKKLYLARDNNNEVIETISECHDRVANYLAENGDEYNNFRRLLDEQKFRPNTPCMANAGIKENPMMLACFVIDLEDSMDSIIDMWGTCAKIYEGGGGAGIPITNLRRKGAGLSKGGYASGPLSYLNVIEVISEEIKSGGKQRRAANLIAAKYNHPDVRDIINCKRDKKSYKSMNLSIVVDDEFMELVKIVTKTKNTYEEIELVDPNEGPTGKTISVIDLWKHICQAAWETGDPGLLFIDRVNRDNPLDILIQATNPCFPGDVKVWTVYGPKSFKELAENGEDIPVLSQNEYGQIEVQMMRNPRCSRKLKQNLIRVHFDDGRYIDCTPNHKWYIRTKKGIKKTEAKNLVPGQSISSLYRYNANQHKRKRLTNGIEDPLQHHVHVAWKEGRRPEYPIEHCHHINGDVTNDNPENLQILDANIHNRMNMFGENNPMHGVWDERNPLYKEDFKGPNNPKYYHHITKEKVLNLKEQGLTIKEIANKFKCDTKVIRNRLKPNNHKVSYIEYLPTKKFVYNGTVDKNHNYFVHVGNDDAVLVANCGESPLIPSSCCDLGHLNMTCYEDSEDYVFEHDIYWSTLFLNRIIDKSSYPNKKFEENMKKYRPIGLGLMGFADYLYREKIRYGSPKSCNVLYNFTKRLTEYAFKASSELVKNGSIPDITPNLKTHEVDRFTDILGRYGLSYGWNSSKIKYIDNIDPFPGNITVTTIAPTGSTALSADCSYSTEPQFGLIWTKVLENGETMEFLNPYFLDALYEIDGKHKNKYSQPELIELIKRNKGAIQNIPYIPQEIKDVFVTAHDIPNEQRLEVQAAAQRNITMAVSSTVNLPKSASTEDVAKIYLMAWEKDLKGITVYRDGSLDDQPIDFGTETESQQAHTEAEMPISDKSESITSSNTSIFGKSYKRPMERNGKVVEVNTPAGKLYVRGSFDNGKLMEVFLDVGQQGSRENVLFNGLGRVISRSLQRGVDLSDITDTLRGSGGDHFWIKLNPDEERSYPVEGILDAVATILDEKFSGEHIDGRVSTITNDSDVIDLQEYSLENSNAKVIAGYSKCPECQRYSLRMDAGCRGGICTVCGYSNCQ